MTTNVPQPLSARQHLKTSAERVGLDGGTAGWAILDKLITSSDGEDWNDIWNGLTSGKMGLLLPLDAAPSSSGVGGSPVATGVVGTLEDITPDFVKHHVILRDGQQFITLSGLRGLIMSDTLTFRSSLSPSSKSYQLLMGGSSFPPLSISHPRYPSFSLPAYTSSLRVPGRPPPRLGFSSLWGSSKASPPIHLPAYTLANTINFPTVASEINLALNTEITNILALPASGTDDWILKRVLAFTSGFFPFLGTTTPSLNPLDESPEDLADVLHGFYAGLEVEFAGHTPKIKTHPLEMMRRVERATAHVFFDR